MYIINEAKSIPSMESARVQRWALTLSAYTYSIKYRKGEDIYNADGLSCLPLANHPENVSKPPETIALLEHFPNVPLSASDRDITLAKVKELSGQPPYLMNSYNLTFAIRM